MCKFYTIITKKPNYYNDINKNFFSVVLFNFSSSKSEGSLHQFAYTIFNYFEHPKPSQQIYLTFSK